MNSILVGKDAKKVAVMDWAEEMRARGWWVDVNTRVNCENVGVACGKGSTTHELEARGCDMVTALIELMKGWDAIYGEAAELDREWKAFVEGLGEKIEVYSIAGLPQSCEIIGENHILTVYGKSFDVMRKRAMKLWEKMDNE